jgi:6-pyruvoyltetrahydropterin/6-carboxytetrahydropterin synthase
MSHRITKSFTFDSAHWLPNVPQGHKCGRMHGHTYTVVIGVEGEVAPGSGWIVDFGDIKAAFKPLEKIMDHRCLNEIEGLENPTAENMARWIFERLRENLPQLADVTVKETPTTAAIYRRDDR